MLDPPQFQFILVKMLDFVSFVCYSVETSAMPSSCYITFILVEILFGAIIIPLHCFTDLQQARATEYSLIHSWKPQLNPTSTTRFAQPFIVRSSYGSPGKRRWMKVRRRLQTLGLLHLYQNTILEPIDNWLLLINLANGGMKAYQTEKRLRSAEFHHHQVYALYRLCNLLDDPPQTAVRAILRRILQLRQCAIPRSPRALVLPLLAHQHIKAQSNAGSLTLLAIPKIT